MAGIIYTPPPVVPTPPTPPGGQDHSVQFNDAGSFNGSDHIFIDNSNGWLILESDGMVPSPPGAKRVKIWGNSDGAENKMWMTPTTGTPTPVQHEIAYKQVSWLQSPSASNFTGIGSLTAFGTLGTFARILKSNDALNNLPNYTYGKLTSASGVANSGAELYGNTIGFNAIVSNNAYAGGGYAVFVFGLPTYATTQRIFVGYTSANAANFGGAGDPSSFLNMIGVGKDSSDNTLYFMCNDSSGIATKINTGITPVALSTVYRLTVSFLAGSNTMHCQLETITNAGITRFAASFGGGSNTPALGTNMLVHAGVNTAASLTAVTIAIIQIYEEQY
jgi:hypothetical protein